MQISQINLSFKAGKVQLYSDFDGTYFPAKETDLYSKPPKPSKNYCKKMDEFFKSTDGDVVFHITTGRSIEGYKDISEKIKKKGLQLPLPDTLIVHNGSDEFKKSGSDADFYKKGIFPFSTKNRIWRKEKNAPATKLNNTKQALLQAIQNKDIVIAAGNDINDFEMLNPLEYIDFTKYKNNSFQDFYNGDMEKKLKDLKSVLNGEKTDYINGLRKELNSNGFIEEIKNLPLYSIVAGKNNSDLSLISETFKPLGKVIEISDGTLDENIKEIVKLHAKKSPEFKQGMSDKFKKFIYIKERFLKKAAIIASAIFGVCVGSIYIYNKTNNKNNF